MATSPRDEVCIGVVIVTFNSSAHVERLTTSLKDALSSVPHHVVVVDNASSDGTVDALRGEGIEVIEMGRNAGYSAGINAGLAVLTDASAVLILNPDIALGRSAVAAMYAQLKDPRVGVVVPQTREFSGALAYNQRRDPTLLRTVASAVLGAGRAGRWSTLSETIKDTDTYLRTRDIDWGVGAVMMISRACLDAVGPWDESFFLYSEETDYCQRVRRHGMVVRYTPGAVVLHRGGGGASDCRLRSMMMVNKVRLYGRQHSRAASFAYLAASILYEGTRGIGGSASARASAVALLRPSRRPPELQSCDSFLPS
ncbi:MAG: N-acetylglucosaminyl-diphospho-decaprenol L-rhamnosyltransferase [Ilumatobacteraceae bacterium]|jgi:GT2 family glycosyltransferase